MKRSELIKGKTDGINQKKKEKENVESGRKYISY